MDRDVHVRLMRDTLKAYGQLLDHWDRQVKDKGPVGDWTWGASRMSCAGTTWV